ncbi:MAG: hypothetical protein M1823_000148 [Watsoniomyces obsoletus]|nr:MAG: hypothetical protein M1823_000148 [Watsoniomyces obsoletus]
MKATPLVVNTHEKNAPIYSTHFEPHGKCRLATAGGDHNVRLWKVEVYGENRHLLYLTTLSKHTQAVNVVRFAPRGEILASAGDDGNVLLWVPSELGKKTIPLGEDAAEDRETWRIKLMCRSSGSEIYDLAWSPDGVFFITGCLDNVARIYNAQTGQIVRQIAEHNHYVQGVAWDPLNEYVATQSSDRSVHIYTLKPKDGNVSLTQYGNISRLDLPSRRISSNSPAPPELGVRAQHLVEGHSQAIASPTPSAPGTPTSLPLPMNPPALTPSRRSSFSSSHSFRRSVSPAPSLPLPAVKPMEMSPMLRNVDAYADESLKSFFRRLTFTPDGSLLLTPAGQYRVLQTATAGGNSGADDPINTVYIYTRAGFNKPPVAHLPGHGKPSIAVRCSPVLYTLRKTSPETKNFTIDTSSAEEPLPPLPGPVVTPKTSATQTSMEPPSLELTNLHSSGESSRPTTAVKKEEGAASSSAPASNSTFALPYRIVYAVATQDTVLIYDTQQQTPLCVVNNLHPATFTDLSWSPDGLTLMMSSLDGFCSVVTFAPGELGQIYSNTTTTISHPAVGSSASSSTHSTPVATPVSTHPHRISGQLVVPGPSAHFPLPGPQVSSPARTNSASSVTTQPSMSQSQLTTYLPSRTASGSGSASVSTTRTGLPGVSSGSTIPLSTPPQTPMPPAETPIKSEAGAEVLGKREPSVRPGSEVEEGESQSNPKKRRIEPTMIRRNDEPEEEQGK